MRQQDAPWLRRRFKARRQIHFAADDGVVHSVLAAEIADCAEARAYAHPYPEGTLEAYEVSAAVNRTANDNPALIEPLPPPMASTGIAEGAAPAPKPLRKSARVSFRRSFQ